MNMKTLSAILFALVISVHLYAAGGVASKVAQPRQGRYTGTVTFRQSEAGLSAVSTRRLVANYYGGFWSITAAPIPDGTLDGKIASFDIEMPVSEFDSTCLIAPTDSDGTPGTYVAGTFLVKGNVFTLRVNQTTLNLTWIGR